jgi:predicted extracellular nuclease
VEQARYVAELLTSPDSIALGDLNDTPGSEPLAQFPGFTNLLARYVPLEERYTYIYNGRAQAIDHILLSPAIESTLVGGQAVHANADFAEPLPGQEGRVSDHDPIVARFRFSRTGLREAAFGISLVRFFRDYHHLSLLK